MSNLADGIATKTSFHLNLWTAVPSTTTRERARYGPGSHAALRRRMQPGAPRLRTRKSRTLSHVVSSPESYRLVAVVYSILAIGGKLQRLRHCRHLDIVLFRSDGYSKISAASAATPANVHLRPVRRRGKSEIRSSPCLPRRPVSPTRHHSSGSILCGATARSSANYPRRSWPTSM